MNNRFSIITPVFNPDRQAFEACVQSVLQQSYQNWEWCLVDDNSTDPWVIKFLKKLARRHRNIKVKTRDTNGGISAASNDAIGMATGSYVVFLDNDDELDLDALAVVNHELFIDPSLDYLYSDEDKIDEAGNYFGRFNKPSWSPEQLLCHNYCCHLSVLRLDLVKKVGGLRSEFDGSQDFDLLLRITDQPIRVKHIPKVLYHWRVSKSSTAGSLESKPYALNAARRALQETCERRRIRAEIIETAYGHHRLLRNLRSSPLVSIVIPTRGTKGPVWGLECAFIENLLLSSISKTSYPNIEFIIVFDSGTDQALLDRIQLLPLNAKFIEYAETFNFSKKCNLGFAHSSGERLIFLNDDMEIITANWIERLICFLEDESIGAVGPLLLLENGLVESGGHLNSGPKNFANWTSRSVPHGVWWPLLVNRETSGVTGACLAMRRETFISIGGFSEIFAENFNDVDLCLKLTADGYRIIWTPDAELFHFELKSRKKRVNREESENLTRYWGHLVGRDRLDPFIRPA
jgi:GT2 family glycosyltransferase